MLCKYMQYSYVCMLRATVLNDACYTHKARLQLLKFIYILFDKSAEKVLQSNEHFICINLLAERRNKTLQWLQ